MTKQELSAELQKIRDKGAKETLKQLNTWLSSKTVATIATNNPTFSLLVKQLDLFTQALKDTYSPNILRFMTKKEAYIQELVHSAKNVQDNVIPDAIAAAKNLTITPELQPTTNALQQLLTAFQAANEDKQAKIDANKGDMVEITTHDIMKKYLKKNFYDIGQLVSPIIIALEK